MSTASEIIANSKSYAEEALQGAMTLADRAASTFYSPTGQPLEPLNIQQPPGITINNTPPAFSSSYESTLFTGVMPEFVGTEGISGIVTTVGNVPNAPTLPNKPVAPTYNVGSFDKTVPTLSIPDLPGVPDSISYTAPVITNKTMPSKPNVSVPNSIVSWNEQTPGDPANYSLQLKASYKEMSPEFKSFVEQGAQEFLTLYAPEYESNRTLIESKINEITAGGTAMTDSIEAQIYERGRTRAEQESNKLQHEVLLANKERGMYIPAGATTAAILQAKRGSSMANAQYASETAIERMKIELQHLQFGLQLSMSLHDVALQSMLQQSQILVSVNGQALQYAVEFTKALVDQYNQRLQLLSSQIDVFKAKIEQARLLYEQTTLQLDVYKAELEAVKIEVDVDQAKVNLYLGLIQSEEAKMNLYTSQIKGIETAAQVEYYKVQIWGEEVKAHVANVQGKTAEFQAYTAAMEGNVATAKIYATEMDGYVAKAKVEEGVANTKLAVLEAEIKNNIARTQAFIAQVSAHEANNKDKIAEFTANSTNEQNRLRAWISVNEQLLKKNQIETQSTIAMNDARAKELGMQAANTHQNTEAWSRAMENRMRATIDAAQVYGSLAGTAMSAQNTMVQQYEEI